MGLTSAMLVGFTGIKSNQTAIDTIGDNVANVNTTAFKNQRALFETVYYRTLNSGSAPSGDAFGGINPQQVGYGSALASLQRSFEPGVIQTTGVKTDVAIDGDGFLVLQNSAGEQVYTRDGSLDVDEANTLVSADGSFVQGYSADSTGAIDTGALGNIEIPVGVESEAVATTEAVMQGNLDAGASVATTGAVSTSAPLRTAGGLASAATPLTSLVDSSGANLFATGDSVLIQNVQRGGVDLPETRFVVGTDGTTLGDFANYLQGYLGIDTATPTPSGQTPGVTVNADGSLVVTSNAGEPNAISIEASNIRNETSGILTFSFTSTPATGEGVSTGFIVYDSLGNPVELRLRTAMESRSDSGTVWRYYVDSVAGGTSQPVGGGTFTFDQNGQLVGSTGTTVTVPRTGTGSANPLTVTLDVAGVTGLNFGDDASTLVMSTQDGRPGGTLIDFAIDEQGIIEGTFSNGQTRNFGQLALATFANNEGLVARGDNTFVVGPNSGDVMITTPGVQGAGQIQSAALELSNVDLSREFVNLIQASTGFSAASRVVRTADDMLQELMLLAR